MSSDSIPNFDFDFDDILTDEDLVSEVPKVEEDEEKKKSRFASFSDKDLTGIISNAEAKGTKKNPTWVLKTIRGKVLIT